MEITVIKEVKENIKYLYAYLAQDWWDSAEISLDGGETFKAVEEDGVEIPGYMFTNCNYIQTNEKYFKERNKNRKIFPLFINVDTGHVENWHQGIAMNIYWKIVDEGLYQYRNEDGAVIYEMYDYVPGELAINDDGYGDYVIINIDKDGNIENWNPSEVKATLQEYCKNKYIDD